MVGAGRAPGGKDPGVLGLSLTARSQTKDSTLKLKNRLEPPAEYPGKTGFRDARSVKSIPPLEKYWN